ncbi:Putative ABC transporter ATP-binding protein/permease [Durusdinium trenchii]|uniref:ABC transporter ATP-binding protein/permease n=1 Tax=Durusdinium trenchii TaxID=1381693 RepID=A0ABP0MH29_9DINO
MPFDILIALIWSATMFWMVGFRDDFEHFFYFFLGVYALTCVATGIGYLGGYAAPVAAIGMWLWQEREGQVNGRSHLRNAKDFIEKYAKNGGCTVEVKLVATVAAIDQLAEHHGARRGAGASEHWRERRCGGACNDCQITKSLEACKNFGWIQIWPHFQSIRNTLNVTPAPPLPPPPPEETPRPSKIIPRAHGTAEGLLSESERSCTDRSLTERSRRTPETEEQVEETSPSNCQS